MQHLYKSFLADADEYRAAESRWRQLWDRIITEVKPPAEWKMQWFTPEFANGTPMRDGNPIFSAVAPTMKRGVRIIQHEPTTDEVELEFWLDTFDADEPISELVISCALSDQAEQRAGDLVRSWITTGSVDGAISGPADRNGNQS